MRKAPSPAPTNFAAAALNWPTAGSLLLDEISEIAPALQAKLLRVLQESCFERVGSSLTQQVDVRVIATTNRDLEQCVAEGKFRQDLFYRLNVVPIELPALRQRQEDIPELCRHFLHLSSKRDKIGLPAHRVRSGASAAKIRLAGQRARIQNILERAVVLETEPGVIRAATIEPWLQMASRRPGSGGPGGPSAGGHRKAGDSQHASAIQRPSRPHRLGPGHRRANAGHEAEALARGRRAGASGKLMEEGTKARRHEGAKEVGWVLTGTGRKLRRGGFSGHEFGTQRGFRDSRRCCPDA